MITVRLWNYNEVFKEYEVSDTTPMPRVGEQIAISYPKPEEEFCSHVKILDITYKYPETSKDNLVVEIDLDC